MIEISLTDNFIKKSFPKEFHFVVVFFMSGIKPNVLDFRFQKVSGLSSGIDATSLKNGSDNLYFNCLPGKVSHEKLVLERGMVVGLPLSGDVNVAITNLLFTSGNLLVALLDDDNLPIVGWFFWKTYPVKWHITGLDTNSRSLVIETMELSYSHFQMMKI